MPDTTVNITLSTAATPSAVQYNSTLIVNGNFSPGSSAVEIVSLSYDSSAITVVQTSSTETQIVYSISALMISNVGFQDLVTVNTFCSNGVYNGEINTSVSPTEDIENYSINGQVIGVESGGVEVYNQTQTVIQYDPLNVGTNILDNDATIVINTPSTIDGVCRFLNGPNGSVNVEDNFVAEGFTFSLVNNLGAVSVQVVDTATGTTPTWLQSLNFNASQVSIVIDSNIGIGTVDRSLELRLFSNQNTSAVANDILTVTQLEGNFLSCVAATVQEWAPGTFDGYTVANQFFPAETTSNYFENLNGAIGQGNKIDDDGTTFVEVKTQLEYAVTDEYAPLYTLINITPNTDWIQDHTFNVVDTANAGVFRKYYKILQNDTQEQRSVTIQVAHPQDPTLTDEIQIVQKAGYSATNNWLYFVTNEGTLEAPNFQPTSDSPAYNSTTGNVEDGPTAALLPNEAGTHTIYAKIPYEDTDNLPSVSATWPEAFLIYDDLTGQILAAEFNEWTVGGPQAFDVEVYQPLIIGEGPLATLYGSTLATHQITFQLEENNAVNANGISISRTFTLKGFNPENDSANPNDNIFIFQKPIPYAQFYGLEETTFATDAQQSNGISLTYKSNSASIAFVVGNPTVEVVSYSELDTNYPGQPAWIESISSTSIGGGAEALEVSTFSLLIDVEPNFTGVERILNLTLHHPESIDEVADNEVNGTDVLDIIIPSMSPLLALPDSLLTQELLFASPNGGETTLALSYNGSLPSAVLYQYYADAEEPATSSLETFPLAMISNVAVTLDSDTGYANFVFTLTANSTGLVRKCLIKIAHGDIPEQTFDLELIQATT
jgi:hypothetical protein